ncbi:hypothetical protein [Crinalium epipsammum]|uniref:hypothetical protein n=1 Tax=Crinalium epipsammum TaxID=241425 RepID=UPI0002DE3C29|nr:hypothetical protein [Crinalium epipsammum]
MLTTIKRNPSDPLLRPDYIRFSWRQYKSFETGYPEYHELSCRYPKPPKPTRNYQEQDLLDLEEKLKVKSRRK